MVSSEEQAASASAGSTNRKTDRALLSRISDALRATRPWTRLLSILGFIVAAILLFAAVGMVLGRNYLPTPMDTPVLILTGAINVVISIFYLIPSIWLSKYSSAISRFLSGGGAIELGNALVYQKSFWKYVGTIILLSIVAAILGILAAIFIPALLMFRN